jgi:DNA-binding CsgD family transcriptional regulator
MHTDETPGQDAVPLADVIDSLSAGVFLIGGDGAIVHANAQARAILASTDMLRVVRGRLVAADPQANLALRDALLAAIFGDVVGSAALPLTSRDGTRHVVQVRPLRASVYRAAAVFVDRATFEAPSSPDVIRRAYQLTPTELRVLFAVVELGGVPDVAVALGIANSTVKTHLGHLFRKTGTRRQADLVKLVAAFSHRLVG